MSGTAPDPTALTVVSHCSPIVAIWLDFDRTCCSPCCATSFTCGRTKAGLDLREKISDSQQF